jgi:NAD(P)-dependent dehydrogenase (short-subunit alcohol dehydrogenase family)
MMTKYLSVELAPSVRVNAVCPGLTMSDTGGPRATANVVQYAVAQTPMGRAAHPSEVAPAVLYLASEAASYTTGALLVVNGGRPWG